MIYWYSIGPSIVPVALYSARDIDWGTDGMGKTSNDSTRSSARCR